MKTKLLLLFTCLFAYSFSNINAETDKVEFMWRINTSNPQKLEEYRRLFSDYNIALVETQVDLDEVDADPMTVIAHKVSQMGEYVLVDDTSLDVDGADVGVNIRWLIDSLDQYVGKEAVWRTLLAYREGDTVFIYKSEIEGTITEPRGEEGYGFGSMFIPKGSDYTLTEYVDDNHNARAKAVKALIRDERSAVLPAIYDWDGPWQH